MTKLSKTALLDKVIHSLLEAGQIPILLDDKHPFLIRLSDGKVTYNVRVYIWNCTHGGKNRHRDEFRIQVTSAVPRKQPGELTVLLGWHEALQVFAAWDIDEHDGQSSSSPSAQIKLPTLEAAHDRPFAVQPKENEIVVAFQPSFLFEYIKLHKGLHATSESVEEMELLGRIEDITDSDINRVSNPTRRLVIKNIVTRYRAHSFRRNVLMAYKHRCAFCGIQLHLVDAAHILPVSVDGSTDETSNGVALCKLHHFAYDSNLISFNERYHTEVSGSRVRALTEEGKNRGFRQFADALNPVIHIPSVRTLKPSPQYIRRSRELRGWVP